MATKRTFRSLLAPLAAGAALLLLVAIVAVRALSGAGSQPPGDATATLSLDERDQALAAARTHLGEGHPAKAEAVLRDAVIAAPDDQDLRTLFAETLLQLDRREEALSQYEHAIVIGPDHAELRFAAGALASTLGEDQRAEEHLFQAQTLAPNNPKHPFYLAQVQRRLGRVTEAKASALRAANMAPELAGPWGTLGAIALDENKLSMAAGYVRRAREAEPNVLTWRVLEAKVLRRDNQPEEALRVLMAATRAQVIRDLGALEEAALCFGLLQRPADAATLYADAVDDADDADRRRTLLVATARWHERAGDVDAARVYASRAAAMGDEQAESMLQRWADATGEAGVMDGS